MSNDNISFFKEVLSKCGIFTDNFDGSIRCHEPSRSIRLLETHLRQQNHKLNEFKTSMRYFLDTHLKTSLNIMQNDFQVLSHDIRVGQADTLIKLLLRLEVLQEHLMEYLVGRMISYTTVDTNDEDVNYCSQYAILNHIRWSEVIYNPDKIIQILLESIPVLSHPLKIEIISCFPALSPDLCSEILLDELQNIAQGMPELTSCVLETVSSLGIPANSVASKSFVEFALELLNSAIVAHLPAITRFLLDTAGIQDAKTIWSQLRLRLHEFFEANKDIITTPEMLDFQCIIMNILKTSFLTPSSSNSSNTNTNISSTASSFVLLDSLMAVINKSDPTEIHSKNTSHDDCHDSEIGGDSSLDVGILPIDMWTLYALYGTGAKFNSKILNFLFKKISSGMINFEIIWKSLCKVPAIVDTIFTSVLSLSQVSISCNRIGNAGLVGNKLGYWLMISLYINCSSALKRQEIVAALIGHILSPNRKEANTGLKVLCDISSHEESHLLSEMVSHPPDAPHWSGGSSPCHLRLFLPFIKSLVDDVHTMTESQQKMIFRVIFQCAIYPGLGNVENAPLDDILIFLKKNLTAIDKRMKKISIIGFVAYITQMSYVLQCNLKYGRHDCTSSSSSHAVMPSQIANASQMRQRSNANPTFMLSQHSQLRATKISPSLSSTISLCVSKLQYVLNACNKNVELYPFVIDELCHAVESCASDVTAEDRRSSSEILRWLHEYTEDRLYAYLGEDEQNNDDTVTKIDRKPYELKYNLNAPGGGIFVKLYTTVMSDMNTACIAEGDMMSSFQSSQLASSKMIFHKSSSLCPILRLLCGCQRSMDGELTELGLLIGSPVEFPTNNTLDQSEDFDDTERTIICQTLMLAVTWFRNVLNIFDQNSIPDADRYRLVIRMNELIACEDIFYAQCQRYPHFVEILGLQELVGSYNTSTGKRNVSSKKSQKLKSSSSIVSQNNDEGIDCLDETEFRGMTKSNRNGKAAKSIKSNSALSHVEGSQLLIIEDLSQALEGMLISPLKPSVCFLLGLGYEPLIYTDASDNLQKLTVLSSGAVNRLLLLCVTCCKSLLSPGNANTYSDLISSHLSRSSRTAVTNYHSDPLPAWVGGDARPAVNYQSNVTSPQHDNFYAFATALKTNGVFTTFNKILTKYVNSLSRFGSSSSHASEEYQNTEIPHEGNAMHDGIVTSSKQIEYIIQIFQSVVAFEEFYRELTNVESENSIHKRNADNQLFVAYEIPPIISIMCAISNVNPLDVVTSCISTSSSSGGGMMYSIEDLNLLLLSSYQNIFDMIQSIVVRLLAALKAAMSQHVSEEDEVLSTQQSSFLVDISHGSHQWILHLCVSACTLLDTILQKNLDHNVIDSPIGNGLLDMIPNLSIQLSTLCDRQLQHSWISGQMYSDYDDENSENLTRNRKANSHKKITYSSKDIGVLIQLHLKWANHPLERVIYFVEEQLSDLTTFDTSSVHKLYPTLTSSTFGLFYAPLLITLTELWKQNIVNNEISNDEEENVESIAKMVAIIKYFSLLIALTKSNDNKENATSKKSKVKNKKNEEGVGSLFQRHDILVIALREGRVFMEIFIKSTKKLHQLFIRQRDQVLQLYNTLQKTTRQLHSLSTYGKRIRDKSLSAETPKIKRVMEIVIYQMKELASKNNFLGALSVGNLKHRHIDGTELVDDVEGDDSSIGSASSDGEEAYDNEDKYAQDEDVVGSDAEEDTSSETNRNIPSKVIHTHKASGIHRIQENRKPVRRIITDSDEEKENSVEEILPLLREDVELDILGEDGDDDNHDIGTVPSRYVEKRSISGESENEEGSEEERLTKRINSGHYSVIKRKKSFSDRDDDDISRDSNDDDGESVNIRFSASKFGSPRRLVRSRK